MKDGVIVELAPIRLAPGKTEADLLDASAAFQRDFLDAQPGFLRRDLVRKSGGYLDIVYWKSRAHAAAMMEKVEGSAACAAFFSVMAMEDGDSGECVEMMDLIARYDAEPRPRP